MSLPVPGPRTRSLGSTAYPTATIGAFKELREPVAIEVVNRVIEHED